MGYKIETVPHEPIIIETWGKDYNPKVDGPNAAQEMNRLMDASREPVTVIVDMRAANMTLEDIIFMAKVASSENAPAHHPKQRRRIIVTDSSLISLAAKGMDSEVFGNIAMDITTSMDEALDLARQ